MTRNDEAFPQWDLPDEDIDPRTQNLMWMVCFVADKPCPGPIVPA